MNIFPLTPAQSWLLIGMVFIIAAIASYLIWYLDIVVQIAICNVKIVGAKGIIYALGGKECYEIRQEKVIEVTRKGGFYKASTSDGEQNYCYLIITSKEDIGNHDYDEAVRLAGDDMLLRKALLPDYRVKNYFALKNRETGERQEFFVVYLKRDNPMDVERALNRYFEEEFRIACRESRNVA